MPSFDEVYEIAASLGGTPVAIDEARCVAVRHRRASCHRCVGVCPTDAITVELGDVKIDFERCVGCGACTQVCPTEALRSQEPDEAALRAEIERVAARGDEVVIACGRKDATREGDPERTVAVPCLSRLGEGTLLFAGTKTKTITLVDGGCASCRYRRSEAAIDEAIAQSEALFAATERPALIRRVDAYPDFARDDGSKARKAARRGFFTDTKFLALEAASKALDLMIEEKLPEFSAKKSKPTMLEKLGMAKYGKLPRFDADRNIGIIDCLEELGPREDVSVESRLFGAVDIRATECNGCGMCVTFCPTRGLQWGLEEADDGDADGKVSLKPVDFSAIDCVACGLCVDLCPTHCIEISSTASLRELFDLEPEVLLIPPAPAYQSPFKGLNFS